MDTLPEAPVEPMFPRVTEYDTHILVVMPADWSLEPLREELRARGQYILGKEKVGRLRRTRCSKPQTPEDEPTAVAA